MFSQINKLSLKFIAVLIPIVTLCALIFLGIFAYLKYTELQKALENKVELIADMHRLAIAEPLWMLNYDSMYRNIDTITTHSEMLCVEVVDTYQDKVYGWQHQDCAQYQADGNAYRTDLEFNNEKVGELVLYYTKGSIIQAMLRELEIGASLFFLLVLATVIIVLGTLHMIVGVPLQYLLESIRIADKKNQLIPVHWSSNDELGTVIAAYNAMIQRIDQRESDLVAARLQAEEANHAKSAFLANMSHELRNPLNAIIGFCRIVLRRAQPQLDEKQYGNVKKILTSAEHLLSLINNILDLAKVESGHIEIRRLHFDPLSVINECLSVMEPLVKEKELDLIKQIDPSLPTLYSDEEKLKQILLNLLSNAAKFTKQGWINIRASSKNDEIVISVTDTGIGVAADELDTIFDEFTQIDSGSTKEYGGTGLGLAISRHLVRLLGGDISVQSKVNEGSTFTLTMPIQKRPRDISTQQPVTSKP